MSEKKDEKSQKHQGQDDYVGSPTTEQMRTVGQRRREAEEKLEHHLEEVRHKEDSGNASSAKEDDVGAPSTYGRDVADIQNDDRLTPADRVDLIANQVLASDDDGGSEKS
ncbi:hypothetical protein QFZ79_003358 [Arthrobacter sp. V4I6]|uniref:hypothetical protein n=1 Tax=unclassified Arthrobacter TaxID=235627 RepID=UPI002785D683|nr:MULTISPECIES: hypothetical protein [unclassified Arthrobacter]MDQ0820986.1 hypothetical protein [Arthrobacter sp. V1I7]MDQ0855247.1 hypothetical protein [Arthrobacter sp. V4I6]